MLQEPTGLGQFLSDTAVSDEDREARSLALQVLNALEQGVVFWSKSGDCLLRNQRFFQMLEIDVIDQPPDVRLQDLLQSLGHRGDYTIDACARLLQHFETGHPFSYDHSLPSGRTVKASARPMRGGGYMVTHWDVTERHAAEKALLLAQTAAEEAQKQADIILLEERARQQEAANLARLDEWLQSCQSLKELYAIVSRFMEYVLPESSGQLYIFSTGRDHLQLACTWNDPNAKKRLAPNCCWALRRGRRYFFNAEGFAFPCDHIHGAHDADQMPTRTLCLPIVAHGDTVGLLHLDLSSDDQLTEIVDIEQFAASCSEHISMAIANVKLRDELQDQSDRDPLTGLYNRRVFEDALRRDLGQAGVDQTGLAILALDADHFKRFNDDHGHDAGDLVLQAIATVLQNIDYPDATVCRIGGEEFTVILPKGDRTRASKVAEDLRHAVERLQIPHNGHDLPQVTISIGIAIFPTHGTEGAQLLKEADNALYAAKAAGRNNWQVAAGDGMISFE